MQFCDAGCGQEAKNTLVYTDGAVELLCGQHTELVHLIDLKLISSNTPL